MINSGEAISQMMTRFLLQHVLIGVVLTVCCSQSVEYIFPVPQTRSLIAVAGETAGWCLVQSRYNSTVNVPAYESNHISLALYEEIKTVQVIAKNVQIYPAAFFNLYSSLPISGLGTKYIVSSCLPPGISNYSSVLVTATHSHKTDVDITFRLEGNVTYDNRTYTDGDTLTVSLQEYQTLTINSDWDLTGTVVRATQTVAVFSGALKLMYSQLVTFNQLLPVHLYGQEYVVAVDDYYDLYQIQIVSDASNTRITFNNGSTVTMDESGIFKQNITINKALDFSSSRPVMAMLCRLDVYGRDSSVVIPPFSLYTKQTSVVFFATLKVFTDKQASDISVKFNSTDSLLLEWEEIPGSRFKVGTPDSSFSWGTVSITSNTSFTVLVFDSDYVYNVGYNFSQPARQIGMIA